MCGIAGIYNYSRQNNIDKNLLIRMTDLLKHRGPDDSGYYVGGNNNASAYGESRDGYVGLGIRRLAIIDLETGHQPIHNEDKTIWIVLNGEIYNFKDLRKNLEGKGHRFYTRSDTETIVHLYEEYGVECLNYLEGMFAFALWDDVKKQLFIARDRIGEKPLVYADIEGSFYFSSEIKSILSVPGFQRRVNYEALHNYFSYIYVPAPISIFEGIKKLPPASYMIVSKKGIECIKEYWSCDYSKKSYFSSDKEYMQKYLDLLADSVRKRLISDVPLGVMLSGGVDSSSILEVMVREIGVKNIRTFSVGIKDKTGRQDPEFERARSVASKFGAEHQEIIFEPSKLGILPEILSFYDEPINLFPVVYAYEMMKHIKKYVTVVLSGNGADEIFGGYAGYNQILKRHLIYEIFKWNDAFAVGRAGFLPDRMKRFFQISALPPYKRRAEEFRLGAENIRWNLYNKNLQDLTGNIDVGKLMEYWFLKGNPTEYLDGIINVDLMFYHSHGHTIMPDISGMSNSLEIRAPFLDHKLIEFAAALPRRMKVPRIFNPLYNKYIMKKSMEGRLPSEILYGRKMGFGYAINWTMWLKTIWANNVEKILTGGDSPLPEYFNMDYVRGLLRSQNNYTLIWGLLVFAVWHKIYIEMKSVGEISERLAI